MLKSRDKHIIDALHLFRCLTRDQLSALFFSHLKSPVTGVNYVLKRLRRDGHITADESHTPYLYFSNPPLIKLGSQKVDHFLKIADFYISICQYLKPTVFRVEPRFGPGYMQPDIFMIWGETPYFVEIQNSIYSVSVMTEKFSRYLHYYKSKEWINEDWYSDQEPQFPKVWIVSHKTNYPLPFEELNIIQTKDVESFLNNYLSV